METQLTEIIQKIRIEGLDRARKEAEEIVTAAKTEAADILASAKKNAEQIIGKAKKEQDYLLSSGKDTLSQIGRDLCIAIEKEIHSYFTRMLTSVSAEALQGDTLISVISAFVAQWSQGKAQLQLSESSLNAVSEQVRSKLVAEAEKKGLTIQPVKSIEGFKVFFDTEASFVDFSPEVIARMLSVRLQPWLANLIHPEE